MSAKGNVRHLAIGSWTHPGRLAFRVRYVTWPLALGLIRNVLHSGRSMFRCNSSSFSSSLIIMVWCVGIPISAGITASLSYVRLKGVSPLLCFREALAPAFEWVIDKLGFVIRDYYTGKPKPAHNVLLYKLFYVLSGNPDQRFSFDLFREVIDGYDDEFQFSKGLW
ncbi:hypothetical protein Tco_0946884 [Tanacetum coccineum]